MPTKLSAEPEYYQAIYLKPPKIERGPSPRNLEIFQAVKVANMTQRAAAEQFKLSPGRISQIAKQVEAWIARTGGGPTRTWFERQRVSEYIHRSRLDTMFTQAQTAWLNSQETKATKVTAEDGKSPKRSAATSYTQGDARYLTASLRVEAARQKFEDHRPTPPEPETMTDAERLREANLITAEELRQIMMARAERSKAESGERKAEEDNEIVVVGGPAPSLECGDSAPLLDSGETVVNDEVRMTNDEVPNAVEASSAAPNSSANCSTMEEPERLHYADPPVGPDGTIRLTQMPSDELLEQFWWTDRNGFRRWRPPEIYQTNANGEFWQSFRPAPPNPNRRKRKPK